MGRRWVIVVRGFLISACAALATACASPSSRHAATPSEPDRRTAESVFEIGLREVSARYVDPLTAEVLAISGLAGLSDLDPALSIRRTGRTIRLASSGAVQASADAPAADDSAGWAAVVTDFADAARRSSPRLAALKWEAIYEAVFDAALADLDPFSRYSTASEARDQRASRDGTGGIGIRFRHDARGRMVITRLLPSGPAATSGLAVGDWITHVDGRPVAELTAASLARRLKGPAGTRVVVTARRDAAGESRDYTVSRVHLVPETVTVTDGEGITVIRVRGFNQGTAARLRSLLADLETVDGGFDGVILDLRGNPGGLLHQAVKVASLFLEPGPIVTTRGRHPDSLQVFDAEPGDVASGSPMVVLVDGGSASSAEIVAAALQERRRAVVVGATSYGKGTVQMIIPLPNQGELALTWSRLLGPSGHVLHGQGVVPTICTSGMAFSASAVERTMKTGLTLPTRRWECPAERRETDFELRLARVILSDAALYRRALSPNATVASARP